MDVTTPKLRWLMFTQVGPYRLDVYETEDQISTDNGEFVHAYFDAATYPMRIVIDARLEGSERWAVLFHEFVHAAVHITGLNLPRGLEEPVCDAVALTFAEILLPFLAKPPKFEG